MMLTKGAWMKKEDGVVLITAILASAVVLILSVSAVSLAIHNTDSSGYDRRRLQAVDAAEAGIDTYYALLNSTAFSASSLQLVPGMNSSCAFTPVTPLSTTPASTFTVTPRFYSDSSNSHGSNCPDSTFLGFNSTGPWYVTLTSVGSVVGQAAPIRTMQSRARLSTTGSGLVFPAAAMLGNLSIGLSANVQVYGNGSNNADLYSNGSISVTTESNIKGNMYVQGTVNIANGNFQVAGNVWASSWVKISGGWIGGGVISSGTTTTPCPPGLIPASASICVSGNTTVGALTSGGLKAGGAISVKSPPAVVSGTQSPNTSGIANPPAQSYPSYTYTSGDWTGTAVVGGSTVNNPVPANCTSAQTAINGWTSGNLYIRLTGCPSFTLLPTKNVPGNLAILTDGGITMTTPTKVTNGDATGASHTVYLFTGLSQSSTAPTCSSGGNFVAQANTGFGSNLKTIVFTPQACSVTINSNAFNATGQIFSGAINFNSNTTLTYSPIALPSEGAGFAGVYVDTVYKREVTS
jgi:hypothetical protein